MKSLGVQGFSQGFRVQVSGVEGGLLFLDESVFFFFENGFR